MAKIKEDEARKRREEERRRKEERRRQGIQSLVDEVHDTNADDPIRGKPCFFKGPLTAASAEMY